VIKSDVEEVIMDYEIADWNENEMYIQLNYEDPSLVSNGIMNDRIDIHIKKP